MLITPAYAQAGGDTTSMLTSLLPFILIFMSGYGYTALMSLLQNLDFPGLREQEA